jgi:hypothetical protein
MVGSLAACGQESGTSTADGETTAPDARPPGGPDLEGPPPLTLHRPEGAVELEAYTWCYHDESGEGGCADGPRPEDPPKTAADAPLTFSFPLDGWSFTADFRVPGRPDSCDRYLRADAVPQGDGTFVVPSLGPAGHWQVIISGWADEGGDLFAAFDWTTTSDSSQTPVAHGIVGLLAPPSVYEDKNLEAYGPSLYLTGLAEEPSEATAEVVLSDGDASATYPMKPTRKDGCPGDGAVSFAGDEPTEPVDLPDLADPPYSYEVHLTMDGQSYTGTGHWPDDLMPPTSNSLDLTWSPPLPAWDGSGGSVSEPAGTGGGG